MGQAKEYAEILGLKFAYSTNGTGIIEFDFFTGIKPSSIRSPRRTRFGSGNESARIFPTMKSPTACLLRPIFRIRNRGIINALR